MLANICFGQSDSSTKQTSVNIDNTICVKIAPLSIIDVGGGPVFRLGVERKIYKNFALYLEGGAFIPNIRESQDKLSGYIIRTEFKFYLNRNKLTTGKYLSIEYFYKTQSYNSKDTIFLPPDPYVKANNYTKYINCVDIRFGEMTTYKNGIILEWFVGAGFIHKEVHSSATLEEQNSIRHLGDYGGGVKGASGQVGKIDSPYFIAGLKLGYSFK
jgi:hypothetical protein